MSPKKNVSPDQGSLFDAQPPNEAPSTAEVGSAIDPEVVSPVSVPAPVLQKALTSPQETPDNAPEQSAEISEDGVSVPISDYYTGLLGALTLGKRLNTNSNFLTKTAEIGSGSYKLIQRKLEAKGKDIETEVGNSKQTRQSLTEASKSVLAGPNLMATEKLIAAKLVDEDEATNLNKAAYRDFTRNFYDPKNKSKLDKEVQRVKARQRSWSRLTQEKLGE